MKGSGYEEILSADGPTVFKKYIGPVVVTLTGNFGGGTAKIQRKNRAEAVVDVVGASYTVADEKILDYSPGAVNWLAVDLSGSTAPALVVEIQDGSRLSGQTSEEL
jgi:hypothetical protein